MEQQHSAPTQEGELLRELIHSATSRWSEQEEGGRREAVSSPEDYFVSHFTRPALTEQRGRS